MNRAVLVSVAALLSLALSACGSGADSRANADTTGDEDIAHIKIGLTYLEQQTLSNGEPLACKVAFEVTNEGNERVKFVLANFALVNSSGEIVADESVGINNLMPGKASQCGPRHPLFRVPKLRA